MITHTHAGPGLPHLELAPDETKKYPIVFCLHGYGADKTDLTGLVETLDPTGYAYVLPDAPTTAFDGAAGPTSRAWYERGGNESREGVADALAALDSCVQGVLARRAIPQGKVVLLGFSQGGAMALRYGLPRPELFAGLAILSSSLKRLSDLTPTLPPERTQPLFVSHGRHDTVVPVDVGRALAKYLEGEGYRPEWRLYSAGHFILPQQVDDLRRWLHRVLPPGALTG